MREWRSAGATAALAAALWACGAAPATVGPTEPTAATTPRSVVTTASPAGNGCPQFAGDRLEPTLTTTAKLISAGDESSPRVEAVIYPRPDYRGRPWTAWGQGIVADNGRFFSSIGDHLGVDGNSYFYEFDPDTGNLQLLTDIRSIVGPTTWGFGKVHGQMVGGPCGEIYFSTYWGDKPEGSALDSFAGDVLLRFDPNENRIEALGSPIPGYGIPSLSGSSNLGLLFGEGVDPAIEPKDGPFFVYDVRSQAVVFASDVAEAHQGFRNVAVDADGKAYFSGDNYRLLVYDPATGALSNYPGELPGKWLRASSVPDASGTIFAATREPDMLFSFTPDGKVDTFGPAPDYVASIALHPDGTRFYYVPSAHGQSWQSGTPLIEVDIATRDERVLAELNPMGEAELGLSFGGTYGIVAAPSGDRLYIVMNSGVPENVRDAAFGEVVLVIVHLP